MRIFLEASTGRLSAPKTHNFHNGELVQAHILKQLSSQKWAIGIRGKVYSAFSHVPLERGKIYPFRVLLQGKSVILSLSVNQDRIQNFLVQEGIHNNVLQREICSSLIKAGLALDPKLIRIIENALKERTDKRHIRILIEMMRKGFPLNDNLVKRFEETVAGTTSGNQRQGEEGNKRRGNRRQENQDKKEKDKHKKAIKSILSSRSKEIGGDLSLLNHIGLESSRWIQVPLAFSVDNEDFSGMLRILFNIKSKDYRALSLEIINNGVLWSFAGEKDQNGNIQLNCFTNNSFDMSYALRLLPELKRKLGKLGVRIDDNIRETSAFDGFSPDFSEGIMEGVDERV